MPTIPLYDQARDHPADAWHAVAAPGGYEWWYFDAEDTNQDVQVVAILFDGFVFHPGYLRAYARYRRNPTRTPPPLAADYRCAYLAVYEKGKLLWQSMTQHPAAAFSAEREPLRVMIGSNGFRRDQEGTLHLRVAASPWRLTSRGPQLLTSQHLSADLPFRPLLPHRPQDRSFLSRAIGGSDHRWIIADPLCLVEGTIQLDAERNAFASRIIPFRGQGYHDHNYGTGPLGPGLRRWFWGRILGPDSACTFHIAEPYRAAVPLETHRVEADAHGVREIPLDKVTANWSKRSRLLLAYPQCLRLGDLSLSRPRVIDSSPFYLRLLYEAELRGRKASAFCEVAYPHRLRWPILGRMVEMSIFESPPPA